jgi:hypothetical protein
VRVTVGVTEHAAAAVSRSLRHRRRSTTTGTRAEGRRLFPCSPQVAVVVATCFVRAAVCWQQQPCGCGGGRVAGATASRSLPRSRGVAVALRPGISASYPFPGDGAGGSDVGLVVVLVEVAAICREVAACSLRQGGGSGW